MEQKDLFYVHLDWIYLTKELDFIVKSLAGEGKLLSAQSATEIIKPAFSFEWTGLGIGE